MNNRDILIAIKRDLGLSDRAIANRLSEVTGDSVSVHAVRSWLANPKRQYARPCPGWVIVLLDQHQRG